MDQGLKDEYKEDEIDLRKYVLVLVRQWRLIRDMVIVALIATLTIGLLAGSRGPSYEATAGVALIKSKTQVSFEDKIKTISPDTAAAQTALATAAQDAKTRRSTLASLVKNPLVAQTAINAMGGRLPPSLRDAERLVGMVEGKVRKDTDVIDIVVRGGDRTLVTDLANAWAVAYEQYVNAMYAGGAASMGSIDKDVAAAKSSYEQARDALLQYNLQDKTFQLQSDIDYRKGVIDNLQKSRQAAITAILSKQTDAQTDFMGKYVSAALNMAGLPLVKEAEAKVSQLTTLYTNKLKIEQTLEDARTLRDQASRSPAGADSNGLAVLLMKAQLATAGGLPSGLQLQVAAPSAGAAGSAAQVSDLEALISTLDGRLKEIQADIDRQSGELMKGGGIGIRDVTGVVSATNPLIAEAQKMAENLLQLQGMEGMLANVDADKGSPLTETMDQLTMEVRGLGAELAREGYKKTELTQDYNIAWQAYSTLLSKTQEIHIASQLPGSEVVFAAPAVKPARIGATAMLRQLPKPLALAVALALLVGMVGALAVEYIAPGSPPVAVPWRPLAGRGLARARPVWFRVVRRARPVAPQTEARAEMHPQMDSTKHLPG